MKFPALTLRSVWSAWKRSQRVGGHHARKAISLQLSSGQWLAVIGLNGVGKSTLLRAIAGNADISGGRVEVNGVALRPYSIYDRFRVGLVYVGQSPALPLSRCSWDDAVALATGARPGLLNETALEDLRRRLEGFRWPVGEVVDTSVFDLVVAIISAPSVLLLDEIGARMKPHVGDQLYGQLRELLPATAVVFVEHDLRLAIASADLVLPLQSAPLGAVDGTQSGDRLVAIESTVVSPILSSKANELFAHSDFPVESTESEEWDYFNDAQRLLELEADPWRLLRRAMLAGGISRVRDWHRQALMDWRFLAMREVNELSGGERVILCSLVAAASNAGAVPRTAIDHVHRENRARLAKYVKALRSPVARRTKPPAPVDQLEAES